MRGKKRLLLPDATTPLEGSGEKGGFDPQDLQSAYDIPTTGGADETIAIVDAYGFTGAEHSLAVYRERYGLPPCTTADGCFRKVNQKGQEANYPGEKGWNSEQALDIEMVSAACPECHILLVQASEASDVSLGTAENTAVRLGAIEVSNSWSSPEQECGTPPSECEKHEHEFFEHPDVMLFFAAGDNAYDNFYEGADSPDFPASLPSVVAVGGTALHHADNTRGWSEETWYEPGIRAGGGSGCSRFAKPSWQGDAGCAGRMTTDVAADAACETPMSVYAEGWEDVCGTSASSPLLAGIEAHAEESVRTLPGAEAFYEATGGLDDVTEGINGKCSAAPEVAYFCRAEPGYDGPTGNGSPEGPLQLAPGAPLATTAPPSAVGGGQATLHGSVSPRGLATTYEFEYGTTTAYGSTIPIPEGSVGQQRAAGQPDDHRTAGRNRLPLPPGCQEQRRHQLRRRLHALDLAPERHRRLARHRSRGRRRDGHDQRREPLRSDLRPLRPEDVGRIHRATERVDHRAGARRHRGGAGERHHSRRVQRRQRSRSLHL